MPHRNTLINTVHNNSHRAQLNAVQKANLLYKTVYSEMGKHAFMFEMDEVIGEGYYANTSGPVLVLKMSEQTFVMVNFTHYILNWEEGDNLCWL